MPPLPFKSLSSLVQQRAITLGLITALTVSGSWAQNNSAQNSKPAPTSTANLGQASDTVAKSVTVCDVFNWDDMLVAKYADVFYRIDTVKGLSQKLELPLFPTILALGYRESRPMALGRDGDRFKIFDKRSGGWHELLLPQRAHSMGEKVRICSYKKSFALVGERSSFVREDNMWREIAYHRMPEDLYDKVKVCQERHYYALGDDVIWRAYGNAEKGGLCRISLTDGVWTEVKLDGPLADLPVTGLKYNSQGKLFLCQGAKNSIEPTGAGNGIPGIKISKGNQVSRPSQIRGIVRCLENGKWKTVFTCGNTEPAAPNNGCPNNVSIQAMCFDQEDNLCLATRESGLLMRTKNGQFKQLAGGPNWPKQLIPVTILRLNDTTVSGTDQASVIVTAGTGQIKQIKL